MGLVDEAIFFFEKNPWLAEQGGCLTTQSEFEKLSKKLRNKIPKWYSKILMPIPLAESTVGIPNDHGLEEFVGKPLLKCPSMWVKFLSLTQIEDEVNSNSLSKFIFTKNYLPIAYYDTVGTHIYIQFTKKNPELIFFYPPWIDNMKRLNENSEVILPSFYDLFQVARNTSFLPGDEPDE